MWDYYTRAVKGHPDIAPFALIHSLPHGAFFEDLWAFPKCSPPVLQQGVCSSHKGTSQRCKSAAGIPLKHWHTSVLIQLLLLYSSVYRALINEPSSLSDIHTYNLLVEELKEKGGVFAVRVAAGSLLHRRGVAQHRVHTLYCTILYFTILYYSL